MKHKKIVALIGIVSAVLLVAVGVFAVYWSSEPEIGYIHTDFAVNMDDPRILVGSKDYVFVCQVLETHDYAREKGRRSFPQTLEGVNSYYTECEVQVLENLKGELPMDKTVTCYKVGGYLSRWKNTIMLSERDVYPEAGRLYVFTGHALEDGTLICGGYNGAAAIECNITPDTLEESVIIAAYRDHVANEVVPTFAVAHYRASVDPGYQDGAYNVKEKQRYEAEMQVTEKLTSVNDYLYEQLSQIAAENAKNGVTTPPDAPATEPANWPQ